MAHDLRGVAPVELTDRDRRKPEGVADGIALCLSGGGYRAMLFHVGALWRLNELGYLPKISRVSSVSGGSIAAGVLGMHWKELDFNGNGVGQNFIKAVLEPIQRLGGITIESYRAGSEGHSDIRDYNLDRIPHYPFDSVHCPFDATIALANIATRLKALDDATQKRLINWGYAICDVAMRKHVDSSLPSPGNYPYPAVGVG